jgi:hypothetical protein
VRSVAGVAGFIEGVPDFYKRLLEVPQEGLAGRALHAANEEPRSIGLLGLKKSATPITASPAPGGGAEEPRAYKAGLRNPDAEAHGKKEVTDGL